MMTAPTRRLLAVAGIALYLLIVALVAFHYNFPYDKTLARVAADLESQGPLKIDFGSPERKLPLTVRVPDVKVEIAWPEGTYPLIKLDRVDLSIRTWALLLGQMRVDIEGGGDNQTLRGKMVTGLFGNSDLRVEIDKIDLPQFIFTDPTEKTAITGHLTGSIIAQGSNTAFPQASQGRLILEAGKITGLNIPNIPVRNFDFDRIELEFELENKNVTIKNLLARGPQTEMKLTGRVLNYLHPTFNLNGSARLGPANAPLASATFQITGSAAAPKVVITSGKGLSLPLPGISGN
jgi:type II secretion system protein N